MFTTQASINAAPLKNNKGHFNSYLDSMLQLRHSMNLLILYPIHFTIIINTNEMIKGRTNEIIVPMIKLQDV